MTTTYDAIAAPTPTPTGRTAATRDLSGVTPELRALLTAYSRAVDEVNDSRAVSLVGSQNRRLPHWLALPTARYFVSAFLLRYLYRCVDGLKSSIMRHAVEANAATENNDDLRMLQNFEESLPPRRRLALLLPVGILLVLSVAYVLAWTCQAGYRDLLGDLMTATLSVNRSAVIAAFSNAHRLAPLRGPLEAYFFAGAAMIVSWSAVAVMVPLLPAFYVVRRKRERLADLEAKAFAAVGARPVNEIELDLVVRLLLILAIALLCIPAATQALTPNSTYIRIGSGVLGAISVALTILAAIELNACYGERRQRTGHCRTSATKISFAVVVLVSVCLFAIISIRQRTQNRENFVWYRDIASLADNGNDARGWLTNQLSFLVTGIQQNAQCAEPHGILIDQAQYLEFDLEVWSDVDQFANQATAYALALPHWSVEDRQGKPTGSLYMHAKCGHGTAAIVQPIVPGTHSITAVVVSAPKEAVCLRLDIPSYHGVWKWAIPPAPKEACRPN